MPRGEVGPPEPFALALAAVIGTLMQSKGVSGRELARRIGKSAPYIHDRLNGRAVFNLNDIPDIAEALGTPLEKVMRLALKQHELVEAGPVEVPPGARKAESTTQPQPRQA